jgi:hypothetical protein
VIVHRRFDVDVIRFDQHIGQVDQHNTNVREHITLAEALQLLFDLLGGAAVVNDSR